MSEEKFDAIIVGGGLAGASAAYRLAREGLEVLVIERGTSCGAKNVTGGRLYGHSLERLIPGFAQEAPIERKVVKERISLATGSGAMTIEYSADRLRERGCASYTVLRAKFDQWLARKAEEAGAMLITGIRVDDLLSVNGKVVGVNCGGEEMFADVVILADGVNSLLAQKAGLKKELDPGQVAVGVKEVIKLDEKTISDRFGVCDGEGAAWMFAGDPTGGNIGGGFLYTNRESLSLGIVTTVGDIGHSETTVPEMVERLKEHPVVAPLIAGGKLLEYSAHLVTEGGWAMVPKLWGDGVLVAGDAAAFVMNLGFTVRGMDLAIESGRLAAETVLRAREKEDFSQRALAEYGAMLEGSFITRDLKHFQKMPALMETREIFNEYPRMVDEIMAGLFVVDGAPPVKLTKRVMPAVKEAGGLFRLGRTGLKAMGAM